MATCAKVGFGPLVPRYWPDHVIGIEFQSGPPEGGLEDHLGRSPSRIAGFVQSDKPGPFQRLQDSRSERPPNARNHV